MAQDLGLLADDMLARFDERAPAYDRENRFFTEDFAELKSSGYLNAAVPVELGGSGLPITEVIALQRRLAYVAPATAVAVNMDMLTHELVGELSLGIDPDDPQRWG